MILVTMVGMTLLFGFVTYYADTYKSGIGGSVRELLVVEDIWMNPDGYDSMGPVTISIYNAGKVDSQITSVYVDGLGMTMTRSDSDFNLAEEVAVGEHTRFTLWANKPMDVSGSYTFTVATKMGSTFDVTYRAP